jgi:hypothetical protein
LDISKTRFRSWGQVLALYVACSFPIFVWAIANVLVTVSQWLLRLTLWETLGVIAYILGYAFLESLVAFVIALVIALILPRRLVENRFIPLTMVVLTLTLGFFIFLNVTQERAMLQGRYLGALAGLAAYLVAAVLAVVFLRRSERVMRLLNGFIDRLMPLTVLYALVGLAGALIVVYRNVLA